MKLDNRGFTLVEVVVVVSIIAVLSVFSFNALNYVNKGDIKEATNTLYSEIMSSRTSSMARTGEWYFQVSHDGTSFILETIWDQEATSVSRVPLSYRVDSIKATYNGTTVDLATIEFQKNTGAVKKITGVGGVLYDRSLPGASLAGYCDIVLNLDGNERKLRLYFLTGEIERHVE